MALLQRLEMRQGQSLVMTPQLLQAIKLLQLSHLDLVSYVEAELERNPLLESAAPEIAAPEPAPAETDRDWTEAGSDGAGPSALPRGTPTTAPPRRPVRRRRRSTAPIRCGSGTAAYAGLTASAWGPFDPVPTSNSTRCPSASER